jgi:hypothetical protein
LLLPLNWTHQHSLIALLVATLACLLPFCTKAFHMDDPLFLWTAQQITHHPLDPYGFDLVWYYLQMHMWAVTKNPPLASYYAALIGRVAGWSELAMHLAFLLPAVALILGTYQLARRFTKHPLIAAAATLFAPAVMVSATGVMCDNMMLALWIWAAVLWIKGLDLPKPLYLLSASLLIAASALTKYFAASLIVLLLTYSIFHRRRLENRLWYLLIPVAALVQYQLWTQSLYGQGLLSDAFSYASNEGKDWTGIVGQTLLGLSFLGGCALPALAFAFMLWSRKQFLGLASVSGLLALCVYLKWIDMTAPIPSSYWGAVSLQLGFYLAGGICVLALAVADLRQHRDTDSLFLMLWVSGTFIFATFLNWTVNARSILPLIPAAGILIARRLEAVRLSRLKVAIPLAACCFLSLWITWGDADFANSAREAAHRVHEKTAHQPGSVWFAGHWGFQYYMQQFGAQPYDQNNNLSHPGDTLIMPENNSNLFEVSSDVIYQVMDLPLHRGVITMRDTRGAGFYASFRGPLPFSFGPVPPEHYSFIRLETQQSQ